jgi:hypothetical protein
MSKRARLLFGVVFAVFSVRLSASPGLELAPTTMSVREVIDGRMICRTASPEELRAFERMDVPVHVIYPEPGRVRISAGLQITLLATDQLEANPTAKAAFVRAAQFWESKITNTVSVNIKVDFGTTRFGTPYPSPNILGSASGVSYFVNYPAARSALVSRADNAAETALYNQLPSGTVPTDIGSASRVLGTVVQLRTLGFTVPEDPQPNVGFNSAFSFDFDPSNGITPNTTDFDAVTVHELGHVLGFGSSVGRTELNPSSENAPTVWDLFRFRPGVTLGTFQAALRPMSSGGDHVSFFGGGSLPMSTGRPDGTGGDEEQSSHWKDNRNGNPFIGLMDPTIPRSQRLQATQNDIDAFAAMGYSIAGSGSTPGTPLPAAPTNLTATGTSATVIRLNWNDNSSNETSFFIEQRNSGGSFVQIGTAAVNATSINVTGLSAGQSATFRVRAGNGAGFSSYTNEATGTTFSPGGTGCTPNSTTVCLVGGRFRVGIAYRNQFANPPATGSFVAARLNPAATSPDTALFGFASANDVEVVVRIVDARPFAPRFDVYYGGLTDVEYTVTVTDTVTSQTKTYRNNPGQVGGGVDRSTFPASAFGEDDRLMSSGGHDVFYAGPDALVSPVEIVRVRGTRTERPEETLSSATPMALTASIGGGAGCSESEPNESTANADTLALGVPCTGNVGDSDPFGIVIDYEGGDSDNIEDVFRIVLPSAARVSASLTFTSSGDLDLFLFSASGTSLSLIDSSTSISGTSESFTTDETLAAGTYYIGVSAYDGSSSYTVTANAAGQAAPPAAPTNLTATLTSATMATLGWNDNATNETGYIVERRIGSGSYVAFNPIGANSIGATISNLQAASVYTFRVKARNASGDSAYSNEASVTTPGGGTGCTPNSTTVCLNGNRFRVSIAYRNQFANPPVIGNFVAQRLNPAATNPDTALFGFSAATDVEVVVRLVDARPFAPRFDVYYGGLTDVEYTVTVTDTVTGASKTYRNNPGQVGGGVDRGTFPAN